MLARGFRERGAPEHLDCGGFVAQLQEAGV
jgi:hypothetical protein